MRVKFIRDEQYESGGRNLGPKFAAGEVYDFTEEFGQRWLRRGAVEVVDADRAVTENTFKAVTKVKVKPPAETVAPVAPPPPNPPVEHPALSPKSDAPTPAPDAKAAQPERTDAVAKPLTGRK